jgi:hypothetical protein
MQSGLNRHFIPSEQVPPPVPHWLSTMACTIFPICHLSFITSYWVILKYVSLGIGQILEVAFSCLHLPFYLCGGKAFL